MTSPGQRDWKLQREKQMWRDTEFNSKEKHGGKLEGEKIQRRGCGMRHETPTRDGRREHEERGRPKTSWASTQICHSLFSTHGPLSSSHSHTYSQYSFHTRHTVQLTMHAGNSCLKRLLYSPPHTSYSTQMPSQHTHNNAHRTTKHLFIKLTQTQLQLDWGRFYKHLQLQAQLQETHWSDQSVSCALPL